MQDLNDKITGGTLEAVEWNEVPSELQNVIESQGLVLSSGDLNQLGKALSGYISNGHFYSDSGIANAYVLSVVGSRQNPPSLVDGFQVSFLAANANSSASTVNVSGLGVKSIKLRGGDDPAANDMNGRVELSYDLSNNWFELKNPKVTNQTITKATIAAAKADDDLVNYVGSYVRVAEYTAGNPIDALYLVVAGAGADDGFLAHNSDTVSLFNLQLVADASVSVIHAGAKGDGVTDNTSAIQTVLDSGILDVYVPEGTYLIDEDLTVPAGVNLYGDGDSTVIRMIGQDTHGRNSLLFDKYQGNSEISAAPAMIVIDGSYSTVRDLKCDGNGFNNYYVSGVKIYQDVALNNGYQCVRIGRMRLRTSVAEPESWIEHSHVRNVTATLTSWGGITIVGAGYRKYTGIDATDEFLIGARYCSINDNTTINTNSNNIATFHVRDCEMKRNRVVNNVHAGIKVYFICRDVVIDDNEYLYDDTTAVSWRDTQTPAYDREAEFSTRSDAIAIGHSDYDTLISNILVTGNKLRGNGLIRNGINVYSDTALITIVGNQMTGFISPISVGVSHELSLKGNTLRAVNYTSTDFSPGTEFFGSDLQYSARGIEDTKDQPALTCTQSIVGNTFAGTGVNHVRGNDWTTWDGIDSGLQTHYEANVFTITDLTTIGAETVKPFNINTRPNSLNVSRMTFGPNRYIDSTGDTIVGADLFFTNQLWIFLHVYDVRFSFTPSVIGGTVAGAATYTTNSGIYTASKVGIDFSLESGWSAHTGTGNLRITGLPVAALSTGSGGTNVSVNLQFSGLVFAGQIAAGVLNGATTVDLYSLTSNGGLTNIQMDTSVNTLRINGSYPIG